jgi:hypothetical protein
MRSISVSGMRTERFDKWNARIFFCLIKRWTVNLQQFNRSAAWAFVKLRFVIARHLTSSHRMEREYG